jgi:hypothetical protein
MLLKRLFRFFKYFLTGLLLLVLLILAGVNIPFVQRLISEKANRVMAEKKLPVQVGKIKILLTGRLGLSGVRIIRDPCDTIVYAGDIKVSVKILPLIFRKVHIKSVTISNTVVNIVADNNTGELNIISLFSSGNNPPPSPEKHGKEWDISVGSVYLSNVRFLMNDSLNGIHIYQAVKDLTVTFEKFSISRRQVFALYISISDAVGGIILGDSQDAPSETGDSGAPWTFKLKDSDLRRINFSLSQPGSNQKMDFDIGRGVIYDASADLGSHKISVGRLEIEDPLVQILSAPDKPDEKSNTTSETISSGFPGYWDISGNDIKISGGTFKTGPYPLNDRSQSSDSGFSVSSLNSSFSDVRISSRASQLNLDDLSFTMANGFGLEDGKVIFKSDSAQGTTLRSTLKTSESNISFSLGSEFGLPELISSYSYAPFALKVDNAAITSGDFLSFLPGIAKKQSLMDRQDLRLEVKCDVSGTADSISIKHLGLKTGGGASLDLSGVVKEITHLSSSEFSLDLKTGLITPLHIRELLALISPETIIPDIDPFSIEGSVDSSLNIPRFSLVLKNKLGNMAMDGSISLDDKSYDLRVSGSHIDLGNLTGIKDLGIFSGILGVRGKDFSPATMKLAAKLEIDTVGYKGYNYRKISGDVNGENGLFTYDLKADDPSFKCDLAGTLNLSDSLTAGQIKGKLALDADKVNIYKGGSVSAELKGGLNKTGTGLSGFATIKDMTLNRDNNSGYLKSFDMSFEANDTLVKGKISAGFLNADGYYEGSVAGIRKVFREGRFRGIALLDSAVSNHTPYISLMDNMFLTLEASYDPFIGLIVSDTVFSFNKVLLKMVRDSANRAMAEIGVDRFNLGESRGYNAFISLQRDTERSDLSIRADSIRYGPVSFSGLGAHVSSSADSAKISFYAGDSNRSTLFDIEGIAYKGRDGIKLTTRKDQWVINGFIWKVAPGDFLIMDSRSTDLLADLHLKNELHTIDIYGKKSEKISFECRGLGLKMILIPGMNNLGYEGDFTGKIDFKGGIKTEITANMDILGMRMHDDNLGNMKISGKYESDTLGNIEANLNAGMNDSSVLRLDLKYGRKADERSLNTEFNKLPLLIIGSLAEKYVSDLEGTLGGRIDLKPVSGKMTIGGEVRVNNLGLRLIPVNTRFYLPGDVIKITDNRLLFNNFTVLDSLRHRLDLNGSVNLTDPLNIIADLQVTSNRIQVMNTAPGDNPEFNGSIFVDSRINLSGELQKPSVSGSIVLAEGTVINYRYTENLAVSETEKLVSFASLSENVQPDEKKIIEITRMSRSPDIEATVEINPNTVFNFDISKGFDIGVRISGGGFLTYSMMPNSTIDLTGLYEIRQGSSELKIPGWPRKDFTITPGSFVKWDGEVDDPDLRVETTSRVRGSYVNPIDSKTRDVNFLVEMKLAGRLSQLGIIFDVKSEDQYITSVFNSMSSDERMRQAINLLIFGSVQLPNAAGSSDYMTQQINQFWESQINSFTKSAVKWFDLSMGIDSYKDASKGGVDRTSVSVQVKKDILKDRGSVMVSGRMNYNEQPGQQSNAVIENFIFEYALDSARSKYLKVYRQQNYEDLLEGEVIKSGVGFIYRKNYDRVSDIWRKEKKPKGKK